MIKLIHVYKKLYNTFTNASIIKIFNYQLLKFIKVDIRAEAGNYNPHINLYNKMIITKFHMIIFSFFKDQLVFGSGRYPGLLR